MQANKIGLSNLLSPKALTPLFLSVALFGCNQAAETAKDTASQASETATTAVNATASAVSDSTQAVGSAVSETASTVVNTTASVATATTTAVNPNMTPSEHQDAREDIMKGYGKASKALRGMAEDPSKFNADELKNHVNALSQDPWGNFPETAKGGDAKDEVWTKPAEFQAEIDKYKTAVNALATASSNATSIDAVKAQIGEVGKSCKSCHESFKADD